ncbi:unnamed protein product [Lota lota]
MAQEQGGPPVSRCPRESDGGEWMMMGSAAVRLPALPPRRAGGGGPLGLHWVGEGSCRAAVEKLLLAFCTANWEHLERRFC